MPFEEWLNTSKVKTQNLRWLWWISRNSPENDEKSFGLPQTQLPGKVSIHTFVWTSIPCQDTKELVPGRSTNSKARVLSPLMAGDLQRSWEKKQRQHCKILGWVKSKSYQQPCALFDLPLSWVESILGFAHDFRPTASQSKPWYLFKAIQSKHSLKIPLKARFISEFFLVFLSYDIV